MIINKFYRKYTQIMMYKQVVKAAQCCGFDTVNASNGIFSELLDVPVEVNAR